MKKLLIILTFVFLSTSYGFCGGFEAGSTTIGLKGSISNQWASEGDESTTNFTGGITLTRFFTENWEFGFDGLMSFFSTDDSDFGYFSGEGVLNYNFSSESKTIPYIGIAGGGVGASYDDETEGFPSVGAQAGIKYFASENMFLNVEARYRLWITSTVDGIEDDLNQAGVFFGINFIF